MKTSAATMPTNTAAVISIASMMRSMTLRGAGVVLSRVTCPLTPPLSPAGRGSAPSFPLRQCLTLERCSITRLVLLKRSLQLLEHGVGVVARLAHAVGPLLVQRLGRLLPLVELRRRDRVDLVSRLGLQLGQAGALEVGPRIGEPPGPLGGAVVVDHLLLRRRHALIGALVHEPLERDGVERRVHVILGDLVEAEEQ